MGVAADRSRRPDGVVAPGGTMPANSPPTNTRLPASARARPLPALSFSSSEGLVPHVGLALDEKNWGAGPLGRTARGLTLVAAGAGPVPRAAIPTMVLRAEVGAPSPRGGVAEGEHLARRRHLPVAAAGLRRNDGDDTPAGLRRE